MTTTRALFIATLLLATAALRAQAPEAPWKTWKTKACSMNYPADWAFDNSGISGTTVVFYGPDDSTHTYRENVGLVIQEAKSMDLPMLVETTEKEIQAHFSEVKILRSETDRMPGEVHTFEFSGKADGHDLRCRETVRVSGGKAYVLTYTADPAQYDEYLYLAEAMLNSFATAK